MTTTEIIAVILGSITIIGLFVYFVVFDTKKSLNKTFALSAIQQELEKYLLERVILQTIKNNYKELPSKEAEARLTFLNNKIKELMDTYNNINK